ncbi:MAG: bifunctional 5,10-methylenetetrahydrofolate dehydrogenase/5,10-methenyltetrahydrofolate cyclohydrolase [Candidatus Komeilibacteria bacterium]|jgi:methylenetetrahydrofolate dehydrogenase (NADP+) / methenyltetrahydrofolate cyclohydrolase|nr:bifunctional 5,10-methylenetetrahydrofolate dehydrogenase/5,10-methenyltetrahydrofolate cyclohydrolase [Candidatus Komeilibacteria bacterium]MBT4447552.1 bifunctional 5,10-methylenetetrahydrofolate dehydrogenase/5,10-methenyltetrahydrofolate cyclohydrolase [Candidatus Komeilibacteria bacterium]
MNKILDGIKIGQQIQQKIKEDLAKKNIRPGLAVILVGEDAPSQLYVSKKKKACQDVGIDFHEYLLESDTSQEHLLETIDFLNKDEHINAILVQLPLPKQFDTDKIITALDPKKDVDGFHKENIKDFLKDKSIITPGLPLGVLRLIEATGEHLDNKQAVIVSKGKIFSQPMIKILEDRHMQVKLIKPDDKDLKTITSKADVLIVSCGQAFLIKEDMVKKDAIVIDIGINKIDNDYVVGDVDYSSVFEKVKFITPVPGGVGPMTIAMLLYNTVELAKTLSEAEG